MKKIILFLLILAGIVEGCRYDDGPLISFHSVKGRLEGTWQIIGFTSDGVDSLQYYNDSCGCKMQIRFLSDENNIYFKDCTSNKYKNSGGGGHFYFVDNKKKMNVFLGGSSQPLTGLGPIARFGGRGINCVWKILKLKRDELKISTDFNGRNYLISFKKE